jgi:hypothetical protein
MKFLVMIYIDESLMSAIPQAAYAETMRNCIAHAEEMKQAGTILDSQQLEAPSTAKSVRVRGGQRSVLDGPFAETKEYLGGFNLIEAADMDEALRIADEFPWAKWGSIEVRPVKDMAVVRAAVAS